jgi:hypothetical protein
LYDYLLLHLLSLIGPINKWSDGPLYDANNNANHRHPSTTNTTRISSGNNSSVVQSVVSLPAEASFSIFIDESFIKVINK